MFKEALYTPKIIFFCFKPIRQRPFMRVTDLNRGKEKLASHNLRVNKVGYKT